MDAAWHARVAEVALQRLKTGEPVGGLESDLVRLFVQQEACGHHEDLLGTGPADTIVQEFALRFGRADVVIFHVDGAATVVEAKDGTRGYGHVVAGIGQAALYAAQLAMTKGALRSVRKALLWSSTGNAEADIALEAACATAGVTPVLWPTMQVLMANESAVLEVGLDS